MADFTEVMRQARRLCKSYGNGCNGECPLDRRNHTNTTGNDLCITIGSGDAEIYAEIERCVMQWAAEHPEPVYPTWREWHNSMFPDADCDIGPCEFGNKNRFDCGGKLCAECMTEPIPADIAEKLGIKPITPNKPVPEHNGCNGCKWFNNKDDEEPCNRCMYCRDGGTSDMWEEG